MSTDDDIRSLDDIRKRRDVMHRAQSLGMYTPDVVADYDALLAVAEAARNIYVALDRPEGDIDPATGKWHEVTLLSALDVGRDALARLEAIDVP